MIMTEFSLRMIWSIMEISESVICQCQFNTIPDLHNSSDDAQPHQIIVN